MLRITAASAILLLAFSLSAAAYTGCAKYRYGSHGWWFCVSDKDGER